MDRLACEEQLARIVQPLLARCALCRKATLECVRERNDTQFHRLTANRLPWPSTRYPDGSSIVYRFSNPALALLLCQSSEDISRQTQRPLPCAPAYSERFHVPG